MTYLTPVFKYKNMGKWTDKLYITRSECLSGEFFGANNTQIKDTPQLACDKEEEWFSLDVCSLSLQPWDKPVCTNEGIIYDQLTILEHLDEHSFDPITKSPLDSKSLIEIQNYNPQLFSITCPITCKDLTHNSERAVLLKPSGFIYDRQVIDEICREFESACWRDPMTDLPFKRSDIVTLQKRPQRMIVDSP